MKKIGIVLNNIPPYSETFFRSKINGLIASGFEVTVFVNHGRRNDIPEGWKVKIAPVLPRNRFVKPIKVSWVLIQLFLRTPYRVIRFIKEEKSLGRPFSEIVKNLFINAHILPENLDWLHFGFATLAIGREHTGKMMKAKTGVSFRGYDINVYPLKNKDCYKVLWAYTDKVHALSMHLIDEAKKLGMPDEIPFRIIPPAVDPKLFLIKNDRQHRSNGTVRLLTVGRLHWSKGYEYALRALTELDERINWHYTIVGDGPLSEKLIFITHLLGIQEKVTFAGVVDQKEISKLMQSHDIYIQPSVTEGFCNAALEAQAAGMAVVVSDAGGLTENVLDGHTGFVVKKRSAQGLAEKILEMAGRDKDILLQIRKKAFDRIASELTLNHQLESWITFYTTDEQ